MIFWTPPMEPTLYPSQINETDTRPLRDRTKYMYIITHNFQELVGLGIGVELVLLCVN